MGQVIVNPYRSPDLGRLSIKRGPERVPWVRFVIWLLAYLYPIWLAVSFYVTWMIAWFVLGHRPRPMLDDPKYIGGIMDLAVGIPLMFLLGMPVLAPLGFAASFFCPICVRNSSQLKQLAVLLSTYVALCVIALLILRADPGRVVEWWID